jgi:hypothetical protein
VRAADDTFISFARLLHAPPDDGIAPESPDTPAASLPVPPQTPPRSADAERDVRLFRARLADAFALAREQLLREIACAVLGRELMLAPPDIAAIVVRVAAEHAPDPPLRVRLAPGDLDAPALRALHLPLVCDERLAPGDAVVEFAGAHVDARLGTRLEALLEGLA